MTKEQFISGEMFGDRHSKGCYFKYIPPDKKSDLIDAPGHISHYGDYHCCVDKVTDKYVYCYSTLVAKYVHVRVPLQELHTENQKSEVVRKSIIQ